jgi:hypothetical protein
VSAPPPALCRDIAASGLDPTLYDDARAIKAAGAYLLLVGRRAALTTPIGKLAHTDVGPGWCVDAGLRSGATWFPQFRLHQMP